MKKREQYLMTDRISEETGKIIQEVQIHWEKSRDQIWMELEKKMETAPSEGERILFKPWLKIAMAAGIALMIGISALVMLYTETVNIPIGQHSEILLPDNSGIKLNAQSTISYKPLLWKISRTVKFEGEAYFDVVKGKQFKVVSGIGKTIVIGTTFNIYSRNSDYKVTCLSGQVRVSGISGTRNVTLNPGQQAQLSNGGIPEIQPVTDTEQVISWLNNRLSFTSVPLKRVFEEIGRQYGISIKVPEHLEKIYTGTFIKDSSVENVLNLVCRPFDLSFTSKADNEYIITGNN